MNDAQLNETENLPILPEPKPQEDLEAIQRKSAIIIISIAVLLLLIVVASFVFLMQADAAIVAQIRDVFIIFMALMSLLTGFALVILMIQLARLINLLQNEIKPMLESTNETISNLRGTTTFLSDNLTEPVIRLNEYLAGLTKLLILLGIARKR